MSTAIQKSAIRCNLVIEKFKKYQKRELVCQSVYLVSVVYEFSNIIRKTVGTIVVSAKIRRVNHCVDITDSISKSDCSYFMYKMVTMT